jgi:preprotein translocase subunit SecA
MGANDMRILERLIMLRTIDNLWREHLTAMEGMRRQAGWQRLRQVRPVDAYKREGYKQFQVLLDTIQHDVVHTIYHIGIIRKGARQSAPVMAQAATGVKKEKRLKIGNKKIGRNTPCPCGSGKKYKHCCGR